METCVGIPASWASCFGIVLLIGLLGLPKLGKLMGEEGRNLFAVACIVYIVFTAVFLWATWHASYVPTQLPPGLYPC